jgi:heme/copper-type cytochrome/quinol oxidase subunit 3
MSAAQPGAGSRDPGVGSFGLYLLLVALAVLFASTVIATWFFRDAAAQWGTAVPSLPVGLLLTTAVLGVLSLLVEGAARAAAANPARAARLLAFGGICALVFLAGQVWNWKALLGGRPAGSRPSFYEFNFYLLTLLHALHVVGGIVFHVIAWRSARQAAPAAAATSRHNAIYWHFLAVVWLVILANLWLTRIAQPADSWLGPTSLILLAISGLYCLGIQVLVMAEFLRRGRPVLGVASVLPPFALIAYWLHAGEWNQQERLGRWSLGWMVFLSLLILAFAIHAESWLAG